MKIKVAILAFFVLGISSCAYKTCPTYAKKDLKKQEKQMTLSPDRAS